MTSSEPASDGGGAETTTAGRPPAVIAAGHLHPGMLFLRLLDGLRQGVPLAVLALLTGELFLLVIGATYFVLAMAYALARYVTFEYRLTDDELITTEGILQRQERRIPINRIQDLSFESTIVRRVFGLVVVSVETASSHGAEARLDSLSRRHAERLRETLLRARAEHGGAVAPAVPPQETELYRATPGDLFVLGLTDNRIGVILAALFGLWELAGQFGLAEAVTGAVGRVTSYLGSAHWSLVVALLAAASFAALLGGWVVSIAASYLLFFDFRLTLRNDVFQRRYGLLTTRAASLPRRKIQRVLLEQPFLRRLLQLIVLRADSAGSGMDPQQQTRGGRDVVAPLGERWRVEALVPVLLPGMEPWRLQWIRVSPRVVVRIFTKGAVACAVVLALGLPALGAPALLALLLLPLSWLIGVLSYRNLAYAEAEGHVALRWGVLGRYRALVPLRKLQAVVVRRTPLDRALRLASLTVYVAGGSPTTLSNLPGEEAREVQDRLVRRAAESPFVW